MKNEIIVILDFGGQYNQLIARRVREAGVYCEVLPYNTSADKIKEINPKGIIITGGPASVTDKNAPLCDKEILILGIPILGICYGMQLLGHMMGGKIKESSQREYGKAEIKIDNTSVLFEEIESNTICWMSHTYFVDELPEGFKKTADSVNCPITAMENKVKSMYAVQFHPEVEHTPDGRKILNNFLFKVCKCSKDWIISSFVEESIQTLKDKIGDKKVLCALSGGVDSSVCAVLISKAVGKQLTCVFVDHGLMRKNEVEEVEKVIREKFDINLIVIDAKDRFLNKLKGVAEPENKRKIIGEEFIRVFEDAAQKIGNVDFLVQGTIYPDIIESGLGDAAVIKSHHNVGGLPDVINFSEIIEPLRSLFKDEVRKVGSELGMPESLVKRQPFPGPGIAVRIVGDITRDKIKIVQDSDYILREEIEKAGLADSISQYFTVLTGMRSVGVMGDERTYEYALALRAVTTNDFMTADWARIPHDVLEKISNRIVNEVKHINRIVYDITSKPPATIEWE